MRIDFVITELNVGGAEKALTEIAIAMQHRGHQVRVLSIGPEPRGERHGLIDRLNENKVPIKFGGFDHWSGLPAASRWLRTLLENARPDLCQSFLFHANCLSALVSKPANLNTLVGGLRVAESNPLRCWLERKAIARMNHLVCVSEEVRSFAETELSAASPSCSVIPNGVDVTTFQNATPFEWTKIGWSENSQVALFVGRFHKQKGIELIQQQASVLLAGDSKRRLLLIGEGPLGDSLRRWATEFGSQRVKIMDWQPSIASFMRAATMLILPSHYEGMPNVILEAMAAARPVVCSRVEGSGALLGKPNLDGLPPDDIDRWQSQSFPPGDGAAMARLTEAFFIDPQKCDRIGQANLQHIKSHFSIDQMVDQYASLYHYLVDG